MYYEIIFSSFCLATFHCLSARDYYNRLYHHPPPRTNGQFASLNYIWLLTLFLADKQCPLQPFLFSFATHPPLLLSWPSVIVSCFALVPFPWQEAGQESASQNYSESPIKASQPAFPFHTPTSHQIVISLSSNLNCWALLNYVPTDDPHPLASKKRLIHIPTMVQHIAVDVRWWGNKQKPSSR